ncbi:MAG TPA: O-antigen ligase family protein [Candidatus Magasanikbacteria bacterium]|nr:O-antigen ligase family protein [Candidatus Magasanikbacteria bacterium]HQF57462.1 O-antigen ligase family protein [Candidatus Magasanikbacteria bacterium]HQL52579.1 O-antigen ligase family protein [Candidatus Magasanikbacteria bacterium]
MFLIIFIIWIIKYRQSIINNLILIIKNNKILFTAIFFFLLATIISIFTSINIQSALGEGKAFYLEPVIMFVILITTIKEKKQINNILLALIISGLITAILAIYQHFTGWLVPEAFWSNRQTYRVTAWYGFPNGVGLFLAPLIPFAIYLMKETWPVIKKYKTQKINKLSITNSQSQTTQFKNWLLFLSSIFYLILAPLAIIFSKGTGPLLGIIGGISLLFLINKKTRWLIILVGLISLISLLFLPQLSNIKQEITFQDRSGQIRLAIYKETWNFLKDNPLVGAGLASYSKKIAPYHTTVNNENIEIFHHPHNAFLTMWVNLGILGLLSFIIIKFYSLCFIPYSVYKQKKQLLPLTLFTISSLFIILIMGLVDSPYIKNDLAMFFWLLIALILSSKYHLENTSTKEN